MRKRTIHLVIFRIVFVFWWILAISCKNSEFLAQFFLRDSASSKFFREFEFDAKTFSASGYSDSRHLLGSLILVITCAIWFTTTGSNALYDRRTSSFEFVNLPLNELHLSKMSITPSIRELWPIARCCKLISLFEKFGSFYCVPHWIIHSMRATSANFQKRSTVLISSCPSTRNCSSMSSVSLSTVTSVNFLTAGCNHRWTVISLNSETFFPIFMDFSEGGIDFRNCHILCCTWIKNKFNNFSICLNLLSIAGAEIKRTFSRLPFVQWSSWSPNVSIWVNLFIIIWAISCKSAIIPRWSGIYPRSVRELSSCPFSGFQNKFIVWVYFGNRPYHPLRFLKPVETAFPSTEFFICLGDGTSSLSLKNLWYRRLRLPLLNFTKLHFLMPFIGLVHKLQL